MNDIIRRLKPRGELLSPEASKAMLAAIVSTPSRRHRRRPAYVLAAACVLLVGVATAVWGPRLFMDTDRDGSGSSSASCVAQLRLNGVIYDGWAYVERAERQRVGQADLASCEDVGREARGNVFPEEPQRVEVWSLPPVESTKAVGVVQGRGFTVYLARGLSDEDRQRVLDQLGLTE